MSNERLLHEAFANYHPQSYSKEALTAAVEQLKEQLVKTEVAKLMLPVKDWEIRPARLTSFLNYVFDDHETQPHPRVLLLRNLDTTSLIICGLCLTQKTLMGKSQEVFDQLLVDAKAAASGKVNDIATHDGINKVIEKSKTPEEFKTSYFALRGLKMSPAHRHQEYSLRGEPCWCRPGGPGASGGRIMFPRLLEKALPGTIMAFLPKEGNGDGVIRMMTPFDEDILERLFGWERPQVIGIETFTVETAVKNQIARVYGDDVFQAIVASWKGQQEPGGIVTKCVRGIIVPSQVMLISFTIAWHVCQDYVNLGINTS